MIHST